MSIHWPDSSTDVDMVFFATSLQLLLQYHMAPTCDTIRTIQKSSNPLIL